MLTKNAVLEEVAGRLTSEPDFQRALQIFRTNPIFAGKNGNALGHFGEACLEAYLEKIALDNTGKIVFKPIPTKAEAGQYSFYRQNVGYNVSLFENGRTRSYCNFDEILLIDGLPVVFEVKLSRRNRHNPGEKRKLTGGCLNYCMRQERIDVIQGPISAYFQTNDFGYVLVTYPKRIQNDSIRQQDFIEHGGLLVPFYADASRFRSDFNRVTGCVPQ